MMDYLFVRMVHILLNNELMSAYKDGKLEFYVKQRLFSDVMAIGFENLFDENELISTLDGINKETLKKMMNYDPKK